MKRVFLAVGAALPLLLVACSESSSSTKDIVSDEAHTSSDQTYYFYVDGDTVHRGECQSEILVKENCQVNVISKPYTSVKQVLVSQIAIEINIETTKISELQSQLIDLRGKLSENLATLADAEAAFADLPASKTELESQITETETVIPQIESAIEQIELQLASNPESQEIAAILAVRQQNLIDAQAKLVSLRSDLTAKEAEITNALAAIATAKEEQEALKANQTSARKEMRVSRGERSRLLQEENSLMDLLEKLELGNVPFEVMHASEGLAGQKRLMARLAAVFGTEDGPQSYGPDSINQALVGYTYNTFAIEVSAQGPVTEVMVELQIELPANSDFDDYTIHLVHPNGTRVLMQQAGSSVLASRANRLVQFGTPSDVVVNFGPFRGLEMLGTWKVEIHDDDSPDSGRVTHLKLFL